jgi:aspartate kinase
MLELATYGTKVIHPRAVELGKRFKIPILIASSFTDSPGTLIHGGVSMEVRNKVSGIAQDLDVAKITVVGVPDRPGIAAAIFQPLAAAGISIDTIVQNASIENITDLTFTVAKGQLAKAMEVVAPIAKSIGARQCASDVRLGKVSIIGTGMQNTPGYAARMFGALSEQGINIQLITTSEIRITCIINDAQVKDAVRVLHRAFELEEGE